MTSFHRLSLIGFLLLTLYTPALLAAPPARSSAKTESVAKNTPDSASVTTYKSLISQKKAINTLKASVATKAKKTRCDRACPEYKRLVARARHAAQIAQDADQLRVKMAAQGASKASLAQLSKVANAARAVRADVVALVGEDGLIGEDGSQELDLSQSAALKKADTDFAALTSALDQAMDTFSSRGDLIIP